MTDLESRIGTDNVDANMLIAEANGLGDILVFLDNYAQPVLTNKVIKDKIIRYLEIHKKLKEVYNIDYSSSLLYNFNINEEVNKGVDTR